MLIEEIIPKPKIDRDIVVIYPGRFQPPHIGHVKVWKWLNRNFGSTSIATSNKVDPPRSPFNFQEKKTLLTFAGVPAKYIVQVKNPYRAEEITSHYDPDNTVLLFAVSRKDMEESPRFSFKPKKNGDPSYFQDYNKHKDDLKPMSQHGYIITVPTFKFNVLGRPVRSATELRKMFATLPMNEQKEMIIDLYGKYDTQIHKLLSSKLSHHESIT